MGTYKHKLDFIEGDLHDQGEMVCVGKKKYGSVNLCLKGDGQMWNITIGRILLHSKDLAVDADAVFEDAYRLGLEIARRWNKSTPNKANNH